MIFEIFMNLHSVRFLLGLIGRVYLCFAFFFYEIILRCQFLVILLRHWWAKPILVNWFICSKIPSHSQDFMIKC